MPFIASTLLLHVHTIKILHFPDAVLRFLSAQRSSEVLWTIKTFLYLAFHDNHSDKFNYKLQFSCLLQDAHWMGRGIQK